MIGRLLERIWRSAVAIIIIPSICVALYKRTLDLHLFPRILTFTLRERNFDLTLPTRTVSLHLMPREFDIQLPEKPICL